jgi:hypothetical protein
MKKLELKADWISEILIVGTFSFFHFSEGLLLEKLLEALRLCSFLTVTGEQSSIASKSVTLLHFV